MFQIQKGLSKKINNGLIDIIIGTHRVLSPDIKFKHLQLFIIDDEQSKKYDQMFQSEKAALLYFILCFLPFLPNDYAAYFIGFSSQKKEVFIPITLLGNLGSSFSLAYLGSGKAFGNPFFLTAFTILFTSGLYWIHAERKKFHLR